MPYTTKLDKPLIRQLQFEDQEDYEEYKYLIKSIKSSLGETVKSRKLHNSTVIMRALHYYCDYLDGEL